MRSSEACNSSSRSAPRSATLRHLVGERDPLPRGSRFPDGIVAGQEAQPQRLVIVAAAGEVDGTGAEVQGRGVGWGVVGASSTGGRKQQHRQPAAGREVVADQSGTGLVDEVDLVVSTFLSGDAEPVEAQRGACQQLGIVEIPGDSDHVLERLARPRELAGALLLDAEIERDGGSLMGGVGGNQLERVAVVACGFLGRQPPGRIACGVEEQAERVRGVDIGNGETSVVGEVGRNEAGSERRGALERGTTAAWSRRTSPSSSDPYSVSRTRSCANANRPSSRDTTNRAATARSRPAFTSATGAPTQGARTWGSKSVPSTAAPVRISTTAGGRWASRRSMASRITGAIPAIDVPPCHRRAICSTNNGLPPVRRWTSAASSSSGLRPAVRAMSRPTASRSSPASTTVVACATSGRIRGPKG